MDSKFYVSLEAARLLKGKGNHFEDDNGYDLFVPYKELENG